MSTEISDVAGPTNNVIVRSRVPASSIKTGFKQEEARRPSGTRDKYVRWHPGCKAKPIQHPNPCKKVNQPFTMPKAPGLRLKNPVLTRMVGRKVKLAKAARKAPAPIRLFAQHPWFTLDVLVGSGAAVLLVAFIITIVTRMLG